jgi:hypothetical protein
MSRGYFYCTGRGLLTKVGSQFFPLLAAIGEQVRDQVAPAYDPQVARVRFKESQQHEEKQQAARKAAK